ncbi:hypothetical protein BU15DRAFT_65421 [Melanogaster broomeanus]|nr:hypothetical protein BU15DRAFT_65421 [Melanogaster broomeanus]
MSTTISSRARGWRIELECGWDVLGPFPVHAREQHFLSPAFPLDHQPTIYSTSLTHSAYASWSRTTADPHGTILVSHPSVPWEQIRATEGWASAQHMNVVRGWLSVHPPSRREADPSTTGDGDTTDGGVDESEPLLRTDLLQGAFFTILPPPDSPSRGRPMSRNGISGTLPVSPARNGQGTRYEVIICGAYESIAPHIVDGTPFGEAIGIAVQCLDFGHFTGRFAQSSPANHNNAGSIEPDSVVDEGQGYWFVVSARLVHGRTRIPPSLSVALFDGVPVRIAPTQTRVVPLRLSISPFERIPEDVMELDLELICVSSSSASLLAPITDLVIGHTPTTVESVAQRTFVLRASLPLTHVPLWTETEHVPVRATYFFAGSMVTAFSVKPPRLAFDGGVWRPHDGSYTKQRCRGNEPILALHGAGVEVLTQSFWADSLMRQKYAWVVMPQGRTAWGLDWHGPSTVDSFASISALSRILSTSSHWKKWGFDPETRVILMGHSNGGQGAWYMASRWPDRVCAVIPAAGYIKSQAYVSWCMSRFAHFVDPALRAVLDSSLTPDDNDLFLGNIVGIPVLAIHGGADDNVPPWHTREQVGILKTWNSDADVTYHEDPGQPHWYFDVLFNKHVEAFLDRVYFSPSSSVSSSPESIGVPDGKNVHTDVSNTREGKMKSFTLTVAVPAESGSLHGWQICALKVPGLLARLQITKPLNGPTSVRTTNVSIFSLDLQIWLTICGEPTTVKVDGQDVEVYVNSTGYADGTVRFVRDSDAKMARSSCKPAWKIYPGPNPPVPGSYPPPLPIQPPQRLQAILTTHAPLTLLVPTLAPSPELSAALRIAHALRLFHALDAQIVSVREVGAANIGDGNLVVIGCAEEPLVQGWLESMRSVWSYSEGAWSIDGRKFERPSSAILFLQPHPYSQKAVSLFLQSTDTSGLERAIRLFPIRTGVLSPDWVVVDGRADKIGAAAVEGAGVYGWALDDQNTPTISGKWVWNERMSWVD